MLEDDKDELTLLAKELSDDAEQIVRIIFEAPEAIRDDLKVTSKARAREGVKWYLKNFLQWEKGRVEEGWKEVKAWVSEIQNGEKNFTGSSVVECGS